MTCLVPKPSLEFFHPPVQRGHKSFAPNTRSVTYQYQLCWWVLDLKPSASPSSLPRHLFTCCQRSQGNWSFGGNLNIKWSLWGQCLIHSGLWGRNRCWGGGLWSGPTQREGKEHERDRNPNESLVSMNYSHSKSKQYFGVIYWRTYTYL